MDQKVYQKIGYPANDKFAKVFSEIFIKKDGRNSFQPSS